MVRGMPNHPAFFREVNIMEAWEILLFIFCAGGMMLIPTGYDLIKGGFRWDGIAVGLLMIAYGCFCGFIALAGILGY